MKGRITDIQNYVGEGGGDIEKDPRMFSIRTLAIQKWDLYNFTFLYKREIIEKIIFHFSPQYFSNIFQNLIIHSIRSYNHN